MIEREKTIFKQPVLHFECGEKKHDGSYPVQHSHDVFGVMEAADILVMSAVHDGHGLQAQALHLHFRRE